MSEVTRSKVRVMVDHRLAPSSLRGAIVLQWVNERTKESVLLLNDETENNYGEIMFKVKEETA